MPLIQMALSEARRPEQKRAMLGAITAAGHGTIDVPVETPRTWVVEVQRDARLSDGVLAAERGPA